MAEDALTAEEGGLAEMRRQARRDVKELRSEFRGSRRFVVGYWLQNLLQLTVAGLYLSWIVFGSRDKIWTSAGDEWLTYVNYMTCRLVEVSRQRLNRHRKR